MFDTPREVEHFAYFGWRARAARAADELRADGYVVALARRGLKTVLQATRTDSLGDETVSQFLRRVIDIVERNGGEYDGWGAPVAQSAAE